MIMFDENRNDDIIIPDEIETLSDEVLQLVPYETGTTTSELSQSMGYFGSSEYNDIDTSLISSKQESEARAFVSKVEQFVVRLNEQLNDSQLSDDLQEYIKQVGMLQYQNLSDIMTLVTINKQMINNIVARINASQAEDYAIIQSYSGLVTQHIKLSRELSTIYKSIPSTVKKMVQEITGDQQTELDGGVSSAIITQNYGETQFNSTKELLKTLKDSKAS